MASKEFMKIYNAYISEGLSRGQAYSLACSDSKSVKYSKYKKKKDRDKKKSALKKRKVFVRKRRRKNWLGGRAKASTVDYGAGFKKAKSFLWG